MKKLLFLLLLLFLKLFPAKANVIINANIKGLQAGKWVYCIAYNQSKQFASINDSVKTVANGFHFKLNIPEGEGNAFQLRIGKDAMIDNSLFVYLNKGTVTITGSGPYFKNATVSGTAAVNDYNAYVNFMHNNPQWQDLENVYAKAYQFQSAANYASLDALQPQIDAADSIKQTLILQWLNKHPNSAISANIINYAFRNKVSLADIEVMLNKLSPEAKNNIPAKELLHEIEVDKLTGIGRQAPDFTQPDTLGHTISLKDFRGKYVLVDFWASWCGPCREENPNVVKAYNAYKDKNFTILSISLDDNKDRWLQAIQTDKMPWMHASDLQGFSNTAAIQYGVNAIPSNFLIDPLGKIVAKDLRGDDLEDTLAQVLKNE